MKEINKAEEQQQNDNAKVSVTSLTDDEIKDFNTEVEHNCFNTEVEHNCFLPIRNSLKDALDVILLTINYFYRHFPSDAGHPDFSTDDLIDSITTAVSTVMLKVDEMDATELAKIAEHDNYVYDAFKLVKEYIPEGVLNHADIQFGRSRSFPDEGYLRKILDIVNILRIPAMRYMGSDVAYGTAICLKNHLAKYPGGNAICTIPGEAEYKVYSN